MTENPAWQRSGAERSLEVGFGDYFHPSLN